jgi:hypothetical protein
MTYEEFRQEMTDSLRCSYIRPESQEEGSYALLDIEEMYARFYEPERLMADRVLGEWLLSEQQHFSTIAFYVIRHYTVLSATPSLQELAGRLSKIDTPMARDRHKEVAELITRFSSPASHEDNTTTYEEFRQQMYVYRQCLVRDVIKEGNFEGINLQKLYLSFDENERSMADRVVGEWLQSDNSALRGDAEYLVSMCNIRNAKPSLEALVHRLSIVFIPSAPVRSELEKVQQIIAKMSA